MAYLKWERQSRDSSISTVEKSGYYPKTIIGNFINGEILTPEIKLVRIKTQQVGGTVLYSSGTAVPFAKVTISGPDSIYQITCDENGAFLIPAVFEGTYVLNSGVWGHTYQTSLELNEPQALTIQLIPGYKDDFEMDLGWTVDGQVTSGMWGRGFPVKQKLFLTYLCGSDGDSPNDSGGFAYTTGLSISDDVKDNEVSGGTTWLVSPAMDLTQMINPEISFDYWLCEFPPNQYMSVHVWISNGVDTLLLDSFQNPNISGTWISKIYADSLIGAPMDQVKIMISAADTTSGQGEYILKVHFDHFMVTGDAVSSVEPLSKSAHFSVYPNPANDGTLYLKRQSGYPLDITSVDFYDLQGRLLSSTKVDGDHEVIKINYQLEDGMYFLHWHAADGTDGVEKVLLGR